MDNLTHSLAGWLLAETGLKHRTRKGLAACVLAANMPDIDVFLGWFPWVPLATHRGFTHGLVGGVLLMPPLLAVLLCLLDRWQRSRRNTAPAGPPLRFGWLVILCYLGALTHPLLDLQNVYAVQLLSPFSTRWFHADGLFIVSPWLLAMMGAGVWLARRRASGRPALAALTGTVGFIVLNIGISALAWRAPAAGPAYARPDRVFAAPEPLLFWRREVIWRHDGMIARGGYDPFHSLFALRDHGPPVSDGMADPLARRAATATPDVVTFLAWSQIPMAHVRRHGCSATVTFGDARFAGSGFSRDFTATATVPVGKARCAGRRPAP